ncbi:glycosyltransferase family 2 protein [Orenia marismortui]|uniref:glycosyltransferase family 2 protein n=1 Tax=Orenia marismortui TaxID=46469 RepID=UPI0003734407|nr:glycosyltransferase [Orenia marismortui]
MPYYSFFILCYNNWQMSKEAINSLINSLNDKHKERGIELIIVNNGSTDETASGIEKLKKYYKNNPIEIIAVNLKENMGYPVGINLGLAECRGEIITVLNNDLIFPPGWFDGLSNTTEKNEDIGMVAPYLSYACGPQNVGVKLDSFKEICDFSNKFIKKNSQKITYPLRIIGACYTIKREVYDKIGGNDLWFGIGICDDDDLSLRISLAGYKLAITGSSFVYHLGTITFNQEVHHLNCALGANHQKFSLKWNLKPHGKYKSREDIIANLAYNRKEHYFPIKIEEFAELEPPLIDQVEDKDRLLLIADWNNPRSQWKNTLNSALEQISNTEKIYIWIPKNYFLTEQVSTKIKATIELEQIESDSIKFFYKKLSPLALLKFLNSFDFILRVNDDFINRYIAYLAREISIPLI